jgi:hypothetical protein
MLLVDCASLEESLDIARDLGRAHPGGSYEIRPVGLYIFPCGCAVTNHGWIGTILTAGRPQAAAARHYA